MALTWAKIRALSMARRAELRGLVLAEADLRTNPGS
jgi:hypothetical protein